MDIDETICHYEGVRDYRLARPDFEQIKKINKLHAQGHTVIMWTARGTGTGKDWFRLTHNQLEDWGVHCHQLLMGKPEYDVIIDNKAFRIEELT